MNNKERVEAYQNDKSLKREFELEIRRSASGIWSFDDDSLGVKDEPFVCGINEIFDQILVDHGRTPEPGMTVKVRFWGGNPSPGDAHAVLTLDTSEESKHWFATGYTPFLYKGMKGAFCPVFKLFFGDGALPGLAVDIL
jgi:hypothetical protein